MLENNEMIITYLGPSGIKRSKYFSESNRIDKTVYDFLDLVKKKKRKVHPEGYVHLHIVGHSIKYAPKFKDLAANPEFHITSFRSSFSGVEPKYFEGVVV